jgi:hypothetical protein
MKKKLSFLFLIIPLWISAQQSMSFGFLPEVAASFGKWGRWSATSKIESMHFLYESEIDQEKLKHRYDRTDLQLFANYKLSVSSKFSAGYQYRIEPGINNHRFIQQLSIKQSFHSLRLGHRIRLDESFHKKESPRFRLRYRLSSEFPLSGTQLDPHEFYLKGGLEALYGFQDGESEIEGRVNAMLGYYFSNKDKLEAGFDYRTDNYLEEVNDQNLWFKIGYFFNL